MLPLPVLAAYGLFGVCLGLALLFHGIPALLAGLLSWSLTHTLLGRLRTHLRDRSTCGLEWVSALVVGMGSLAILAAIVTEIRHYLAGDSIAALMLTLADTLQHARRYLPASVASQVPESLLQAKGVIASALKEHANTLARMGSSAVHHLALMLIGWIVGVLVAARCGVQDVGRPAFAATWLRLWRALGTAFGRVAFAQAKIAAMNAALTGGFLFGVLPLLGWKLPYTATLVLVTFVCGLLPIVGNLISNALLCTLALSVAFPAAVVSLVFLVVAHKTEYFISARIQGHEIGAQAWELLIVLFAFETLFGPAGMVAAPVLYAFATAELRRLGWLGNREAS